jgi:hypothetical protein
MVIIKCKNKKQFNLSTNTIETFSNFYALVLKKRLGWTDMFRKVIRVVDLILHCIPKFQT